MAVNPMISAGANGIHIGIKGLQDTAQTVAEMNVQPADGSAPRMAEHADVAEAMIDLKVYQRQVQASAKVVQTADETIGFLIDVV